MAASTSSNNGATPCVGLAAYNSRGIVHPFHFHRPAVKGKDVRVDIHYCGMCHSDVHTIRGEWGHIDGHLAPGHEIAGKVVEVGPDCDKFKVGDVVGVGCMVGSCGDCDQCGKGWEQHCDSGMIGTYNSKFREEDGCDLKTQGGYTTEIVVDQKFVFKVPDGADLELVGPLLCAGITTYSPLKSLKAGPGVQVAVAGLGGLGHMAVKIAVAMGAEVTVLSRSHNKDEHAMKVGAKAVIAHTNKEEVDANGRKFDIIINTIPFAHDCNPMLPLIKPGGTMCFLGGVSEPQKVSAFTLLGKKINITGSLIGGCPETQEMLDFCVKHNIYPESETITADKVNDAIDDIMKGNKAGRYTIDVKASKFDSLPEPTEEERKKTKVEGK